MSNNIKKIRKSNKKIRKSNKKARIIIGTSIVVVIGLGYFLANTIVINENVKKWNNKFYPGVIVNGVDVSGKTKNEADEILKKTFVNAIIDKKMVVKAANEKVEIYYKELKPEYNINEVLEKAFQYGKNGNIYSKNKLINEPVNKKFDFEFKYNAEKIKAYEKQLSSKIDEAPKNATMTVKDGNINIVDSKIGHKINVEQMDKLIKDSINGIVTELVEVQVPIEEVEPKITTDILSKINGKISYYSTSFAENSHPDARDINLQIATNAVNGKLLLPGDEFSYNDTVGERTLDRGFKNGVGFVGDKAESMVGGGICQVSTTLYRAVMNAGIKSTERYNHSQKTGYSDYGLDATVYFGSLDYKFKNTYDFPIYIEGYLSNKNVVFNIYGNVQDMGGKSYELLAEGLKSTANNGWSVSSYLITKQNGSQINKEKIATDTYQKPMGS